MRIFAKVTTGVALGGLLAACNATEVTPVDRLEAFETLDALGFVAEAAALAEDLEDQDITAIAAIPTTGSASYDGLVGGDLIVGRNETSIIGRAAIDVDFAGNDVTGKLGRFVSSDDVEFSGSLTLRNGRISRTRLDPENVLRSNVRGTLRDGDDQRIVVDGALVGGFLGTDGAALGGEITGDITYAGEDGSIDAGLVATRN